VKATTADREFPAELQLLLALVRTAFRPNNPPPPAPPTMAWPALLALVERHRLAPFLHLRAASALAATCPPEIVAPIRASAAQTVRRSLAQTAELFRLLDVLETAQVPALVVKGVALAQQLHGGLGARFASDLDLVVAPENAMRADAALRAAGLRRSWPDFALTPRQTRAYLALKSDFEYCRDDATHALRIELLWRLECLLTPPRTAAIVLGGREVRTLSLEDHALYLLQHGARHAWHRLFWLVDIALLLERRELDWSALLARARASGSERALLQGTTLACHLLGSPPPAALAGIQTQPSLLAEARRQITRRPRLNESAREWSRQLHYRLGLAATLPQKWRVLAPHLFTPINWQVWRLPDRWFWLYYPATPFLWVWRYLRRS